MSFWTMARSAARKARKPQRHDHETQLADRGVGKNFFDVILDDGEECRQEGRQRTDIRDDMQCFRRSADKEKSARQEVYARRHHRRRVDECADRRRAFHGVRQPDIKGKLRGFAYNPAENKKRCDNERSLRQETIGGKLWQKRSQCREGKGSLAAAGTRKHTNIDNAYHKPEISHTVYNKRLIACVRRGRFLEPKADQKIGAYRYEFPEHKKHQKIIGKNNPDHRKREKRKRRKVARKTFIALQDRKSNTSELH